MGKTGQGAGKSWAEKGASGWSEWLRRPCRCDAVSRAAGIWYLCVVSDNEAQAATTLPSHCTDPDGTFMLLATHTHGDIAAKASMG